MSLGVRIGRARIAVGGRAWRWGAAVLGLVALWRGDAAAAPGGPGVAPPAAPTLEERCVTQARSEPTKDAFFAVCVDATAELDQVVTVSCAGEGPTRPCEFVGELLRVKRGIIVYLWNTTGLRPKITLDGDAGSGSMMYVPAAVASGRVTPPPLTLVATPDPPQIRQVFSERAPGNVRMTVALAQAALPGAVPAVDVPVRNIERQYVIEAFYRSAFRMGFGLSWAPWARRVGVQTSPNGQKYSAVLEGEGVGLVTSEIVLGYSYFPWEMPASGAKVCVALGMRVGLIGAQGSSVGVITSLMVGPELTIGRDFSIGVFGGLLQHHTPVSGQEPGHLLPANATEVATNFNVTPGFGVVLNYTPEFIKAAGVIK